jgi:2-polyprenyl-6-methoxyphenol hydroxylase-like FAD-dependent oxidoreductase
MSSLSNKVDVLIVGAGPTGLLAALELARAGVEVEVIDQAWRSTTQSYACGVHPSTLELLGTFGVQGAALEAGKRVDTMGFYQGAERRAEIRFDQLQGPCPFLLVLPQDRLEELLEEELRTRGVRVRWGHRLDDLKQDENAVTASVEKLGVTSTGYPVARSEEMVESVKEVRARYLVGADGSASHVRHLLGIQTEHVSAGTAYDVFEFELLADPGQEVRVAMGAESTDVFWPQPGHVARWSLELAGPEEHPDKQRQSVVVLNEDTDAAERRRLTERIQARAPWFTAGIKEIEWTTVVGFDRMLARGFGTGRCWLAGDAGHQTGPVGMQSMNVGLREAADLGGRLRHILREGASPNQLAVYEAERLAEWRRLLGRDTFHASPKATPWVKSHLRRLPSCLPGSGSELRALAAQLGLEEV